MPLCGIWRQWSVGLGTDWRWFQISFRLRDTYAVGLVALATFYGDLALFGFAV